MRAVLLLILLGVGLSARAEEIRIGLSFAEDRWVQCTEQPPLTVFNAYVLLEGAPPISGFALGVQAAGNGHRLNVLSAIYPPGCICMELFNWIAGLGACGTVSTRLLSVSALKARFP